jgi:glutamate-1-semialdehyde aminotransferase
MTTIAEEYAATRPRSRALHERARASMPSGVSTVLVARHNDLAHVRRLCDEHEVAAVILEPAGARSMVAPTHPGFLRSLRALTRERGIVLIFDEDFTLDVARLDRGMGPLGGTLHLAMLLNGVDDNRGSANGWLNAAMTDADVDETTAAFDRGLARMRDEGALP